MPTITLSVTDDLKKEMDQFDFINWSAVAREAIKQKATELALFKSILVKSKLTQKEADAIADKINSAMHEKHKKRIAGLV